MNPSNDPSAFINYVNRLAHGDFSSLMPTADREQPFKIVQETYLGRKFSWLSSTPSKQEGNFDTALENFARNVNNVSASHMESENFNKSVELLKHTLHRRADELDASKRSKRHETINSIHPKVLQQGTLLKAMPEGHITLVSKKGPSEQTHTDQEYGLLGRTTESNQAVTEIQNQSDAITGEKIARVNEAIGGLDIAKVDNERVTRAIARLKFRRQEIPYSPYKLEAGGKLFIKRIASFINFFAEEQVIEITKKDNSYYLYYGNNSSKEEHNFIRIEGITIKTNSKMQTEIELKCEYNLLNLKGANQFSNEELIITIDQSNGTASTNIPKYNLLDLLFEMHFDEADNTLYRQ